MFALAVESCSSAGSVPMYSLRSPPVNCSFPVGCSVPGLRNFFPLDVQSLGADLCDCKFDQESAWVVAGDYLCGGSLVR